MSLPYKFVTQDCTHQLLSDLQASWPALPFVSPYNLVTLWFRYDLNQIPYDYTVKVTNRFKGLDLIDRVTEELRTEVCDIVQETGIKTISKKKKCKTAKWLSKEALQIAVKRREAKSKGEKERYTHLNAEFQRKARRYKKAFLSDQWKEIEKNSRMGKTRKLEIPRGHFMQRWAK